MMMQLLAETAAGPGLSPQVVGTIIGSVILALLGGGALGRKVGKSEAQQIGPQPFIVQLREEFATRREMEKLESQMIAHVAEMKATSVTTTTEMKSLFRESMAAMTSQTTTTTNMIERRHKAVMDEIGKVASSAYQGRQKLWEQVNEQREGLAAVKATGDVAAQISKLADVLAPSANKIQTPPSSKA